MGVRSPKHGTGPVPGAMAPDQTFSGRLKIKEKEILIDRTVPVIYTVHTSGRAVTATG